MRNPNATLHRSNCEWGRKARKEEDKLRGFRHRGRVEAIADQLDSNDDQEVSK